MLSKVARGRTGCLSKFTRTLHQSSTAGDAKTSKLSAEYPVVDHAFDAVVVGAGRLTVLH